MGMLDVIYNEVLGIWYVINTFDGVILGRFNDEAEARLWTFVTNFEEREKLYNEYG